MKVILLQNIKNLGEADEIKEVASGYARNFLFPKKLAQLATSALIEKISEKIKKKEEEIIKSAQKAKENAEILEKTTVSIRVKTQKGGKLFAAITARDVALAINEQTKQNISHENIIIDEPIKKAGEYRVKIKIYKNVSASVKIRIVG